MELGFVEKNKNKNSEDLYSVIFTISIISSILFSLFFFIIYNDLFFAFLVLLGCFITINSLQLTFWIISEKNMQSIINFRISKAFSIVFFQFFFIFFNLDKALIIGHIFGICSQQFLF